MQMNEPPMLFHPVPPPPASRRPCLLLVDDQRVNIQALRQVFADDHQLFVAFDGLQALQQAERRLPDLILLDVEMPDIDGYEVCRRLGQQPSTRDIPVIFVTSHGDEQAETRGLAAGAVDFITKPFNPAIVRARVKTHLTLKAQADQLRACAYQDGLTGVANRRSFEERLEMEWRRAARLRTDLSLMMIDVDHFKRFNDRYGHLAGDDCLRRVADALARCLNRPTDLLARYGGEEFAALLPDTDAGGAFELAQRLRAAVQRQSLDHADSPAGGCVTVSIGLCGTVGEPGADVERLLREADRQLYLAKAAGRDRVCAGTLGQASARGQAADGPQTSGGMPSALRG